MWVFVSRFECVCICWSNVLTPFEPGALDSLEKPTVAFVRLKEALELDSASEARGPVRFIFVLVGPNKTDMDYRETGRAMAALMADKVSERIFLW